MMKKCYIINILQAKKSKAQQFISSLEKLTCGDLSAKLYYFASCTFSDACSPQSGHGVYTTPIDFYLTKKKGSLHLNGIEFCDFSYIIYLYPQKKLGLIRLF